MCIDSDEDFYRCKKFITTPQKASEKWHINKAFIYDGISYVQFKQDLPDGKYQTATRPFYETVTSLKYNNHKLFLESNYNFEVNMLCPVLKKLSLKKLDRKDTI